jgi:hypothetical protein
MNVFKPQFSTPVAIDPALVQNDLYARNLCWPMCVQMACPTGEQVCTHSQPSANLRALSYGTIKVYSELTVKISYAEAYAPVHMDGLTTLQPILLPTDQFVHPNRFNHIYKPS